MLLKLNIERPKKEKLLQELTGDSFSFIERLQNKIFGSPRYDIISIEPDIFKEKPPGRICANIEIRKKLLPVCFFQMYFHCFVDSILKCRKYKKFFRKLFIIFNNSLSSKYYRTIHRINGIWIVFASYFPFLLNNFTKS